MTHITSKTLALLLALALAAPALACDEHKPVTCTSTTSSFNGQTRTVCR